MYSIYRRFNESSTIMANETDRDVNDRYYESGATTLRGFCAVGKQTNDTKGAVRFTNIVIPQGSTVNFAKIFFSYNSVGSTSGTWKWRLYGMDEDNTADFSSYPMSRTKTTAYNQYNEGEPTSGGSKTLDCESIVNEIVGRGGWSSGNAIGFLLEHDNSDTDVYAFLDGTDSYFVYRLAAEPNFKPTPTSITAGDLPEPEDWGLKISYPEVDVTTAEEADLFFTSRKNLPKIFSEGEVSVTLGVEKLIAHNQPVIPFVLAYARVSGKAYKLPTVNYSAGNNVGTIAVDSTYIRINAVTSDVYYFVFLDEIPT